MDQDAEHLRLLSILYYVWAGIAAFFACFPLIYLTFGLVLILLPQQAGRQGGEVPPAALAWFMVMLGGVMSLVGWAGAVCNALAGRFLKQRRHYIFCMVMAGLNCIQVPLGTVLGVFTFIVLTRESVKSSFNGAPAFVEPLDERFGE